MITEAIRLYPPAWIIGRSVTADLRLDAWHLPAGSVAAVSPLLLHRDPRWYPDPDRFDPGRWLGGHPAPPRNAYLPFGTGPRACIGEQFAWTEAVAVLATLARSWTFHTAPGFRPALGYQVTLRPSAGMPVTVRTRPPTGAEPPVSGDVAQFGMVWFHPDRSGQHGGTASPRTSSANPE